MASVREMVGQTDAECHQCDIELSSFHSPAQRSLHQMAQLPECIKLPFVLLFGGNCEQTVQILSVKTTLCQSGPISFSDNNIACVNECSLWDI